MTTENEPGITVTENGPYLVTGSVPMHVETIAPNADGGSWTWEAGRDFEPRAKYALCRCGQSSTKPYCDGTHARVGFDGTETASRAPFGEQAQTIDGPAYDLQDADVLCAFARFCDNDGTIWKIVQSAEGGEPERVLVHEGTSCPSGRLVLRRKTDGDAVEPKLEASIALVEDPVKKCAGPLWVRGGITIRSHDGTSYETRNRVTLCRCGASANKPFCDGTHADVGFTDGLG